MADAFAIRRLGEIHASLPKMDCKGICQDCCGSPLMGELEWQRIVALVGDVKGSSQKCPLLLPDGGCSCYSIRPTICRLWYTVRDNRCPYGCEPDRWLTQAQFDRVILESVKLSRNLVCGPGHPTPTSRKDFVRLL